MTNSGDQTNVRMIPSHRLMEERESDFEILSEGVELDG